MKPHIPKTLLLVSAIALFLSGCAPPARTALPPADLAAVSPTLQRYTNDALLGDVWKRPGLSPRDRSLVTLAVLIARNQSAELPYYLDMSLANGLRPSEVSELITHLAFYTGWSNVMPSVTATREVFERHGIGPEQLPAASVTLLPIDPAAEASRATAVEQSFGTVAPGVVHYTTEILFHQLWLRPGLAPRDRSLVTVAALVANGQTAQITYHLNRAMDNGVARGEVSEVLTQLAFYAGWPNVSSALPVVKDVFERRTKQEASSGATKIDAGGVHMEVQRAGSQPAAPGAATLFTGALTVTPLFPARAPTHVSGGAVTFTPGARSHWHTHPVGQVLIITGGTGWVQEWGGERMVVRAGDVVWTPPGVKHWHGATATESMTHIAVQEHLDGDTKVVEWLEPVTDEQYLR